MAHAVDHPRAQHLRAHRTGQRGLEFEVDALQSEREALQVVDAERIDGEGGEDLADGNAGGVVVEVGDDPAPFEFEGGERLTFMSVPFKSVQGGQIGVGSRPRSVTPGG